MKLANVIIAVTLAVLAVCLWGLANLPEEEPPWPERIQGFSFSPFRAGQGPLEKIYPSEAEIDADLALLEGKTHAIRTYTVEDGLDRIPALARKHGLNVALGVWIKANLEENEADIRKFLKLAVQNRNIVRVVVGNEVLLRGELPVEQMITYLDWVRRELEVPVSTAEPWHVWVKHPELADHVDYIAVHMLPYWEGLQIDEAIAFVKEKIDLLKSTFPDKPVVIAEVGWPSNGRTRLSAVASLANQAAFLRRFLELAQKEHYVYYVMEAFDQPWKRDTEGAVGAYWGVYDVARRAKFPFTQPIVPIAHWYVLAGASVLIAFFTYALVLIDSRTLGNRGRSFLAVMVFAAASAAVWVVYDYLNQYLTVGTVMVGVVMIFGMIGVIAVLLTEAHEWAEARWVVQRRRPFRQLPGDDDGLPLVSIHVPTYNEPPQMVIETLDALARLNYPRFEVIVIDNNTQDPAVWQPVEAHCRTLGARFRFYHETPLAGFKAGALNYALAHSAPEAEIIGVIDSDYTVAPDWLRTMVPQFADPGIGIAQAPQDYRDADANFFKAMCYAEYRGFFFIGMVTRNDRNAIIQHGTMTLIRRAALEAIGGWSEWCITEDAELGLKLFEEGFEAVYSAASHGRGLIPDTFLDFKKQRYRWAYGAVQILRRHAARLLGWTATHLTYGQRYHFIAGWLPWLSDGFNLLFNLAALGWTTAMIAAPKHVDPPLVIFSILPLALFAFKISKQFYLYRTRVKAPLLQTLAAAAAGLALSHTIAQAVLNGFVTQDQPFYRTPKMTRASALTRALTTAREEILMLLALVMGALSVAVQHHAQTLDVKLWVIMLLVQAVPYMATLVVAMISALPSWKGPLCRGTLSPQSPR